MGCVLYIQANMDINMVGSETLSFMVFKCGILGIKLLKLMDICLSVSKPAFLVRDIHAPGLATFLDQ